MEQPSKSPPSEPPSRTVQNANLIPGLKPEQERGPDGKVRKKRVVLPAGGTDDLDSMLWVKTHDAKDDRNELDRFYRSVREKNPERLLELIREEEAKKGSVKSKEPIPDATSDMLEALCEKFLAETRPGLRPPSE